MLPYPENVKIASAKPSAIPVVPSDVVFDLGLPELLVGLRHLAMPFASVPEASVDENNEIDEGDEEVGFSRKGKMLEMRDSIGDKPILEDEFRRSVFALYPGHDPASLLFGNPVHNRNIVVFRDERQDKIRATRENG